MATFERERSSRGHGCPVPLRKGEGRSYMAGEGPKRAAARALALAASSSRFLGSAVVSRERSRRVEMAATSSMADWKASSLALEGLLKPVIFLTNWREAARTSSGATGGSKLKSVLMLRHMSLASVFYFMRVLRRS